MDALIFPVGRQHFTTLAGLPLVGGKLFTFDSGTTNPRTTWIDGGKVSPNTNPIILDARGEAIIFWSGAYRIRLEDSVGTIIWPNMDGVSGADNTVIRNDLSVANIVGEVAGLKIGVCAANASGFALNPAAGDFVALYPYINSSAVRNRIWAINPILDIPSGFPATAWCMEGNVNVATANAPDPRATNHALGIDMVSGGTFAPSSAFSTFSTTNANRWKHGMWFEFVGGQATSTLIKALSTVSVDFGLDIGLATVNFQGVRVGATNTGVVAGIGIRQLANNTPALFLQRFTDTAPTGYFMYAVNAANNAALMYIDALGSITALDVLCNGNSTALGIHASLAYRASGAAPITAAGQISYGATVAAGATAGANGATPAQVAGYININVAGTNQKIPYYNA